MEQAVARCPEITMIIKGQKVRALLDMGSQVTLMKESYFLQNIQQLLPTVDKDPLNSLTSKGLRMDAYHSPNTSRSTSKLVADSFTILAFSLKRTTYLSLIPREDLHELPPS